MLQPLEVEENFVLQPLEVEENFVLRVLKESFVLLVLKDSVIFSLCFNQVVTDQPIHLSKEKRILETVVPTSYQTKSGALNKARALQYCLGKIYNI